MIAVYVRISQDRENELSTREQRIQGSEFAQSLKMPYQIYEDKGLSGTLDEIKDRPAFSQMIDDILEGKIKIVYAYDQSRLERNPQVRFTFKKILLENNVKLYDANGEINLENDEAEMLGDMMSIMNSYYVKLTKKKIKAVVNRRASEGKSHGILPYGFKNQNGNLEIDEEEAEVIKKIFDLQLKGWGQQRISNYLNENNIPTRKNKLGTKPEAIWESATIFRILKNKLYMGKRQWKGKEYDVEPIIDPITFDQVQQNRIANRTRSGAITEHKYLLYQTMRCAECGSNLAVRSHKGKPDYSYYTCTGSRNKKINCKAKPIKQAPIEEFIWERFFLSDTLINLVKESFAMNNVLAGIDKYEKLGEELKAKVTTLENKRKNAVRLAIDGVLSDEDVKAEITKLDREKSDLELKIRQNDEHILFLRDSRKKQKEIEQDLYNLKTNTSFKRKRELVSKYIKKISIWFLDPWFTLGVGFTISELPMEMYMLGKDYQFAIDVDNRIYIPLAEELKNTVIPESEWEEIGKGMDKLLGMAYQRKFN